jgi:hypothetical protein
MSAARLSPEELVQLASNNENRVGDVLPNAGAIRHFLYVTLLRPEVIGRLLSSVSREVARNRLQRYIREEFENVLGAAGDRFNGQSTRQLYDEFMGVLERRIQRLKERKRAEGKNSNKSTSGRQQQSVRPAARRALRPAQGRATPATRPAAATAAPAAVQNRRRRASNSPQHSTDSAPGSHGTDEIALMFGDMNIERPAPAPAPAAPRRVVRARRTVTAAPTVTIVVPVRQSTRARATPAQAASAERRRLAEEQSAAALAARERAETRAEARAVVPELERLLGDFRL